MSRTDPPLPSGPPPDPNPDPHPAPAPDPRPDAKPGAKPGAKPAAPNPRSAWSGAGRRARALPRPGAALALLVAWIVLTSSGFWQRGRPGAAPAFPPQILAALMLGAAIVVFRWRGAALGTPRPGWLRLMWLPGLYLLGFAAWLAGVAHPPASVVLALTFTMFWVALSEELMFRGLLFAGLRGAMGFWPAVLLTSAAFGLVHLMNALGHGSVPQAAFQSLNAFLLGLLFLALRLRSGSLWPPILLHWLWNVAVFSLELSRFGPEPEAVQRGLATPGASSGDPPLALMLLMPLLIAPLGAQALWLMRRAARPDMPGDCVDAASHTRMVDRA